jgi:hypothetical protein
MIMKALGVLQKEGKAEIFQSSTGDEGVKFFS